MSRKRTLAITTSILLLAASLMAITPFISSMNPSARAYADLPRFKVPNLEPNSFTFVEHPLATQAREWGGEIMIVERQSGHRDYWYIPTRDGKHALPDYYSWRPGVICNDLAPDFAKEEIYCRDAESPSEYRWSLDGVALTDHGWVPDLGPIQGMEKLGDFVIFHPEGEE